MRKTAASLIFLCFSYSATAQQTSGTELQTGNIIESMHNEGEEEISEDDSYDQFLNDCKKNPIDLNTADEENLEELRMLNSIQVLNFIIYRKLLGAFIDVRELQSIPAWDVETILKIIAFVTIKTENKLPQINFNAMKVGEHNLLLRSSLVLQRAEGFRVDSVSQVKPYAGSPERISLRYRYKYKNFLQYGFAADKDAGEEFFKGSQRYGFDFYSAHFFLSNYKSLKAFAIGDFSVNAGQGLLLWQSMSFKKSSEVLSMKRQSDFFKPYNSFGEINFQRGVGMTIQRKSIELSAFASSKKVDANLISDTLTFTEDYISSLQQTGFHRTAAELADKRVQHTLTYGFNVKRKTPGMKLGLNVIANRFSMLQQKEDEPYNHYSFRSDKNIAASLEYEFTKNNFHFFGESAVDYRSNKATINGLLMSVSSKTDLAFLYRNIGEGFHTFNSNAFTESSAVNNERGFYSALSFKPDSRFDIRAYFDIYSFPWLKYLIDAPGRGFDYLLQVGYKPFKTTELTTRFKFERKSANETNPVYMITPVGFENHSSWRTQLNHTLTKSMSLRERIEISWYKNPEGIAEQGFLFYTDLVYKPLMKRLSGNLRAVFFDTDSYNTRIYAYEPDVLYAYFMPVFSGSGFHYCFNINYELTKKISVWAKWLAYKYLNISHSGSGLDVIDGNKKYEIRLQMLIKI